MIPGCNRQYIPSGGYSLVCRHHDGMERTLLRHLVTADVVKMVGMYLVPRWDSDRPLEALERCLLFSYGKVEVEGVMKHIRSSLQEDAELKGDDKKG